MPKKAITPQVTIEVDAEIMAAADAIGVTADVWIRRMIEEALLQQAPRPRRVIPSTPFLDTSVTFQALGVLAWVQERDGDFQPIADMDADVGRREGSAELARALNELVQAGYCQRIFGGGPAATWVFKRNPAPVTASRVPSSTIHDTSVSYRALGVLVAILERAVDGVVEGKFGADTRVKRHENGARIGEAEDELCAAGYYRRESWRGLGFKKWRTEAVSATPVASWVEQNSLYPRYDETVPLEEQNDGSFCIRYPDGTLHADEPVAVCVRTRR